LRCVTCLCNQFVPFISPLNTPGEGLHRVTLSIGSLGDTKKSPLKTTQRTLNSPPLIIRLLGYPKTYPKNLGTTSRLSLSEALAPPLSSATSSIGDLEKIPKNENNRISIFMVINTGVIYRPTWMPINTILAERESEI